MDDVLEYSGKSNFPSTGETGKIYVDTSTNLTYRWSGSAYVEISPSLALGTTSSTAFAGDKGNTAYTHAVTNKGSAFANGLYKITTNSEGHVTAATAVSKSDITALGIPSTNTTYGNATQSSAGLMSAADKLALDKKASYQFSSTGSTTSGYLHLFTITLSAAYAAWKGIYSIQDNESRSISGIFSVEMRNGSTATTPSCGVYWLASTDQSKPGLIGTYVVNSSSVTYNLYLTIPGSYRSYLITPLSIGNYIPTQVNSIVTSYTGTLGAQAETVYADLLKTSRSIQTNLGSTTAVSFNGSANITPGVTGTLGIANGGTGATSASAALTNLGAAAASHTHSYLPLSGGTLTGQLKSTYSGGNSFTGSGSNDIGINFTNSDTSHTVFVGVGTEKIKGGLYDRSLSSWVIYSDTSSSSVAIPKWASIGSSTKPVYFSSSGIPVACGSSLAVSVTGTSGGVTAGAGSSNVARHIWFSDNNTETSRNYDDAFTFNPWSNALTISTPYSGSWMNVNRIATFTCSGAPSSGSAASVVSMKTTNGAWSISNLGGNDNLYFVYCTDTNYNAGVNTTNSYYITTAGNFTGKAANITGTCAVANGGTGATTFTSGYALIGNGTSAIATRAITNNTSATAVAASTNLITANTLYYHKGNSNITTVGTITSGIWQGTTIAVAKGGTGLTASPSMLVNLASTSAANVLQASPRPGVTGTLPIGNGGTGASTAATARTNLGICGSISCGTSLPSTTSGYNTGDIFFVYS